MRGLDTEGLRYIHAAILSGATGMTRFAHAPARA
jgi:hypothetical protein